MSGARAAIARLSLALRVLLYGLLLVAIGYIGFTYSAGYVALPGYASFAVEPPPGVGGVAGQGDVIFFRTNGIVCEKTDGSDGKPGENGNPGAPGDCVTAAPIGGVQGKFVVRMNDGDVDITITRDGEGKDARGHIVLRTGGKVIEADFTGTTLPDSIASALPADKKTKVEEILKNPPAVPVPPDARVFEMRLPPPVVIAPAPGAPEPSARSNAVIHLSDGEFDITITRDGEGQDAKGHIVLRTGGKVIEADFTGTTLPAAIAAALPADKKAKIEELLKNPPMPPVPPEGAMLQLQRMPGMPAAPLPPGAGGTAIILLPPPGAGGVAPLPPGDFDLPVPMPGARMEVTTFQGPALLQQQLRGHTAIRATLVGITIALVVLAMVQLERLLAHFQKAELFSSRNSGLLRNIGLLLIAIAFVQAASTLLPAILVKALHPVLIGALGPHLFLVFAGLVLCLLSQVVSEGGRLEDEAAHTV